MPAVPLFSAASRAALSPASWVASSLDLKGPAAGAAAGAAVAAEPLVAAVLATGAALMAAVPAPMMVAPMTPPVSPDAAMPTATRALLKRAMDVSFWVVFHAGFGYRPLTSMLLVSSRNAL